jgi:DNA polymerase III sliding clamp (beta) subunit (PCNA family)
MPSLRHGDGMDFTVTPEIWQFLYEAMRYIDGDDGVGVLIEAGDATVTVTGGDSIMTYRLTEPAEVNTPGAIRVTGAALAMMRAMTPSGPVRVRLDCGDVVICFNGIEVRATWRDSATFPQIPPPGEDAVTFEPDYQVLAVAVLRVLHAAATSHTSMGSLPGLIGVAFEPSAHADGSMDVVATDTYRLARVVVSNVALTEPIVIPTRACSALIDIGDNDPVNMSIEPGFVTFTVGSVTIRTKTIDDKFPLWQSLLTASPLVTFTVNTVDALTAFGEIADLTELMTDATLRMTIGQGRCSMICPSRSLAEVSVETSIPIINATGPVLGVESFVERSFIEFGVNPMSFAEGLAQVPDDEATITYGGLVQPIVITGTNPDEYISLVMPIRL